MGSCSLPAARSISTVSGEAQICIPPLGGAASPPSDNELRPGRKVDYIQVERAAVALIITLLLISMLGYTLAGFREKRRGAPVIFLLKLRDYAIVVGLAVLVPLVAYMALSHATQFGGQGVAINLGYPVWAIQLICFMLLPLLTVGSLVRWRLGLTSPSGSRIRHWVPLLLIGTVIILASCVALVSENVALQYLTSVVAAIAVIVSGVAIFSWWKRAFVSPETGLVRSCVPACGAAILLIACAIPFLEARERTWIERETILIPGGRGGFTSLEQAVTDEIRKDLAAVFGLE